jgi:hypothetical protein
MVDSYTRDSGLVKGAPCLLTPWVGRGHRGTIFASYIQTFSSARGVHSIQLATP